MSREREMNHDCSRGYWLISRADDPLMHEGLEFGVYLKVAQILPVLQTVKRGSTASGE
jgi:hypothetical protein